MIYLDNAATTLHKPDCVIDAVCTAMHTIGNSARGVHGGSLDAARTIYEARLKIARFFGCPDETGVVFTSNVTESLNIVISGLINEGDHVITTDLEHNSVLRPLYRLENERGVSLSFVRADNCGRIDYSELENLIRNDTKAIVTTHVSNLTGNGLDVARIGQIAHKHGLFYIVDAAQSAGSIPINMERDKIDVVCFTGHKGLYGPQGTGGICVMPGISVRPFKVGGTGVQSYLKTQPVEMPVRLEAGTMNAHGIAGLSTAIDYINRVGVGAIHEHEANLARRFYEAMRDTEGVTVYGDYEPDDGSRQATGDFWSTRGAIVAVNIRDYDSAEVADILAMDYDIATRAGAHCAPRMHEALGTTDRGAVRFSFSYFNTEEEVDSAITAVRELAQAN